MVLRVGYVREHFSSPLLQFAEEDGGKTFTLVECPSGTGQLIGRLEKDEIDVAIALTDPLISGIAKGSKAYKLVGSYVTTPLNWAVITGKNSPYNSISDLKGTTIVNNDIRGLIDSVNDGSTSAFMWEWFTTKPFVDAGECRFVSTSLPPRRAPRRIHDALLTQPSSASAGQHGQIGSVPTPWPSWLIAAHPERAPASALTPFLEALSGFVRAFDAPEQRAAADVAFIKDKFGYAEEDIKAWLKTVGYPQSCLEIPRQVILDTLSVLEKAGFVQSPEGGFDVGEFVNTEVVTLV
ncbi:hypothetical protein ACG7TL_007084 [Trametes sanguinea]